MKAKKLIINGEEHKLVSSVNGQTGDVTIDTSEASSITTTQPANPVEGDVYYDTNNGIVKVYDGSQWNEVGGGSADVNTKTFYLSGASDLINAQRAIDWYLAGKNPIIVYGSGTNTRTFVLNYVSGTTSYIFTSLQNRINNSSVSEIDIYRLRIAVSSGTVTNIYYEDYTANYLATNYNYSTPYTPQYPGSPATKKYVDDLYSTITVTLTSSGWSNNTQTVTATGVTANNSVVISPDPAGMMDYTGAMIYCSAQASNSLTFNCTTTPNNDIVVNVLILN